MIGELVNIAAQCDGVRCDMAMLVLPDVFERTWGIRAQAFWPQAMQRAKAVSDFCFMAEVYWDLEWTLQHQGFDYTYDKRLYDRLRDGHARPVREHFWAGLDYQDKLARFLENHDEPRAARLSQRESMQPRPSSPCSGAAFFHQGNFRGARNASRPICVEARRTHRPAAGTVLRPAAGRAPSAGRAPRPVAIARMRPRLGRQLDLGLLRPLPGTAPVANGCWWL